MEHYWAKDVVRLLGPIPTLRSEPRDSDRRSGLRGKGILGGSSSSSARCNNWKSRPIWPPETFPVLLLCNSDCSLAVSSSWINCRGASMVRTFVGETPTLTTCGPILVCRTGPPCWSNLYSALDCTSAQES